MKTKSVNQLLNENRVSDALQHPYLTRKQFEQLFSEFPEYALMRPGFIREEHINKLLMLKVDVSSIAHLLQPHHIKYVVRNYSEIDALSILQNAKVDNTVINFIAKCNNNNMLKEVFL